jgi:hypothetical protein
VNSRDGIALAARASYADGAGPARFLCEVIACAITSMSQLDTSYLQPLKNGPPAKEAFFCHSEAKPWSLSYLPN